MRSVIDKLNHMNVYESTDDIHFKTTIKSSFNEAKYRACWDKMSYGQKRTGGYLKLNDGLSTGNAVFRVEDDRIFGNFISTETKLLLYIYLFVFIIFIYGVFHLYYELVIIHRIKILRGSLSSMLVDEHGNSCEHEDHDNHEHHAEARKMKLDELGTLKFIARKRIEVLKARREASIKKLIKERERTDILVDSENMFTLSNGRIGRGFLQSMEMTRQGNSKMMTSGVTFNNQHDDVRINDQKVTLMSIMNNPYGFEMFKDYCNATDNQNYLFFVLDVCYLRSLEKFYHKKWLGSGDNPKIVNLAKMIGQKYIAKMGSMNIEISKAGRRKLMNLKNYAPGMYDDAFLEIVAKLNNVFKEFKHDYRFQELKIIIEFQRQ